MNWEALNAVSGTVSTAVVLIGTLVALRQLREVLQARHLQAVLGMMQQLESRSVRATRRFLGLHREHLARICLGNNWTTELDDAIQQLSSGRIDIEKIRDDLAILEYVALLALHGMIPVSMASTYFLPIVVNAWADIAPIVQAQRRTMGSRIYLQHFECLYILAVSGKFEDRRERQKHLADLRRKSIDAVRPSGAPSVVNK
jgi:hypothetical protein